MKTHNGLTTRGWNVFGCAQLVSVWLIEKECLHFTPRFALSVIGLSLACCSRLFQGSFHFPYTKIGRPHSFIFLFPLFLFQRTSYPPHSCALLLFSPNKFLFSSNKIQRSNGPIKPSTNINEKAQHSLIKNTNRRKAIILHCQSFHSVNFDFVEMNMEHCLPKVNLTYKIIRFFPNKQRVLLKCKQLPPLDVVEVLAFETTRSSHSSVLISWSLCSWLLAVKLSLSSVYLKKEKRKKGWGYMLDFNLKSIGTKWSCPTDI